MGDVVTLPPGPDALRNAAFSIAAGVYDVVLVLGVDKLKDLVEKRDNRGKDSGGEIFIIWGCIILACYGTQLLFPGYALILSLIFMGSGILFQIVYLSGLEKKQGYRHFDKILSGIWLGVVGALMYSTFYFGYFLKMIDGRAVFSVQYFLLAAGMTFSGIFSGKVPFYCSAIFLLAVSILNALFFQWNHIIFFSAYSLSFVVMGIWLLVEKNN